MKHLIMIAAVVATLTPLSAHAQGRLSDADFVAGTRCVAYADHRAIRADAPNVDALRQTLRANSGHASLIAHARADEVREHVRGINGRSEARAERLREQRATACAPFVTQGLVQMDAGAAAS